MRGGISSKASYPQRQVDRQCTDVGCLLALVGFMVGLWYSYVAARSQGNLAKLTHGFNWKGQICGVDEAVKNTPLLFWCEPEDDLSLMDGICVERCPHDSSSQSWCPGQPRPFEYGAPGPGDGHVKEVVIGMVRNVTRKDDYHSVEAFGYCFPRRNVALLNRILKGTHISTATKQLFLAGNGAMENWRFLICVAVSCIVIGYAFLFVLWSCFSKLIYGMVIIAHVLLVLSTCGFAYVGLYEEGNFFRNYLSDSTAQLCAWGCGCVTFIVWLLYSILCCHSKGAVSATIDSVKASCEVIGHIPTMLFQPLLQSASMVATLLLWLYGFAWVLSTGTVVPLGDPVTQGGVEISGLHRSIELSGPQWMCVACWMFGGVWVFESINALGQFAISHAVINFACFNKEEWFPMLHGYFVGLVYHFGTLAFGGFIIGCLKIIAAFFSVFARRLQDEVGIQGAVARILCCCCLWFSLCIERILTMVNDLVYTDVALQGTSYVEAAENVVQIAGSNPATYALITGSATAVRVLGVTTITCLGTFMSYQLLSSTSMHQEIDVVFEGASSMMTTSNIMGTTIAAAAICLYIAMAFMMVFYQTTYTLMYCMMIGAVQMSDVSLSDGGRRLAFVKDDAL